MKKTVGFILAIAFVAGLASIGVTAAPGIKCQIPAGKSCACIASDSTKCADKYKEVFSCTPNQDVGGLSECPKK